MALDFTKLGGPNLIDTAVEPVKLFAALPRAPKYQYLRNVQAEVLEGWFQRRKEKDLVLKMNTGAGKTVVGLLLLKSSLNEGVGPSAYITPDKYLAEQVLDEGRQLGIEVTDDVDARYLSGKAILVDNISRLINGRSIFGVQRSTPLKSVLIDDAHSCLRIAEEKYTITLPANHPAYRELLDLFRFPLEQQSRVTVLDVIEGDPTKLVAVPYWSWRDQQATVLRILHKYRSAPELEWSWPLVSQSLANCVCVIGGRSLSISARCLDIGRIRDFENASRRIYTTATLADDSALVTHLRANAKSVEVPVTPKLASDIGDRMIIAPQELNPEIADDELMTFVNWMSKSMNVVVIVPSIKRAAFWNPVAKQVLNAENLRAGVDAMRAGVVGVTVLVNKYDGVDLPGDACRALVIDGLPEIERPLDRWDGSTLENSDAMLTRHIQRIEQGMGRGIRSNDDFCVVFLMGARLVERAGLPQGQSKFTPATRAQLELSRRVAAQLVGKSMDEIYNEAVLPFLNRVPGWVTTSRATVASITSEPQKLPARPSHIRAAYDEALLDHYQQAATEMQSAVRAETDERVQGWLKEQLADYTHAFNPAEAQQIQLAAQKLNRLVLKPLAGIVYPKLNPSDRSQAETLSVFLRAKYKDTNSMVIGYNSILSELRFHQDSFRQFEAAIQDLGEHLGFRAHRPEIEFGNGGPDDLWAVGGQQFVMIECKNEATATTISKDYVDKSAGRQHWFDGTYGPGCSVASVMVHPSYVVSHYAAPDPKLRIMTVKKLAELTAAVRSLARSIANSGMADVTAIGKALDYHNLTAGKIVDAFTESFVMEPKQPRS